MIASIKKYLIDIYELNKAKEKWINLFKDLIKLINNILFFFLIQFNSIKK